MKILRILTASVLLSVFLAGPALGQQSTASYAIDSDSSILRVYVGRAGVLARMGHNHVVHTREISGQIDLAPDVMASTAAFSFPVSSFIVDDQEERDRAGDGFESQPGESAIEGTRENMLGEDVLNAEAFPVIELQASPASVDSEEWLLNVNINIQGNSYNQEIPATVNLGGSEITVKSRFSLDHENLGLSPFSALGGSLRVAETIDFELLITARAP